MTAKEVSKRLQKLEETIGVGEPEYKRVVWPGGSEVLTVLEFRNGRCTGGLPRDSPLYQFSAEEKAQYDARNNNHQLFDNKEEI